MIAKFDNVGASGYIADIPAYDLPEDPIAWSSIRNMKFRGGLAERVQGYAAGFDLTPSEAAYGLFSATQLDGTKYIIACADGKVYTYNSSTERDITGAVTVAATADTKWTGGLLTGILILNESVNDPVYITVATLGSGSLAALSNWPSNTKCKVLRPFKYFLVAGNMTETGSSYPFKVRWSTAAVPGALPSTWVAATGNSAGSVDLSADDGPIIDMMTFGDQMAIYRNSGITMMRYTGGTEVMSFNRVPSAAGGGLVGNNCVADVPGVGHVCLSVADMYVFNGTTIASVIDKRMRRWLQANISSANAKRSFVVHHQRQSEVWACFPLSGSTACDVALMWNYSDNTIGIRDLPNVTAGVHDTVTEGTTTTFDTLSGTYATTTLNYGTIDPSSSESKTVLSSTANKLYVVGNAVDADGSSIVGELERTGISLGDAQRLKYVRAIWPRIEGTAGQEIEITVGTQMAVDESVDWAVAQTYTIGSSRKVNVDKTGRFIALRFRSSSGGQWRMKSFDVDVEPRGLW